MLAAAVAVVAVDTAESEVAAVLAVASVGWLAHPDWQGVNPVARAACRVAQALLPIKFQLDLLAGLREG